MKTFLVIVHILVGSLLVFLACNEIPRLYLLTHNPSSYYPEYATNSGVQDFVQNVRDTMPQTVAMIILKIILGVFAIVSALAFRKDRHWATLTLPLPPLVLFLYSVFILVSSSKSDLAWTGGIIAMGALILLVFLILEISYLAFRKKTQIVN